MHKKIFILFITLFSSLFFLPFKVNASSSFTQVYVISSSNSYKKGDTVDVSINLDNFAKLSEVKLQVKIDSSLLTPVVIDEKCFMFSNSSFCQNDIINDFVEESILRLRLIKSDELSEGYCSSYKNNVCSFKFIANVDIENIFDYFRLDSFESGGMSLYLFDTSDNIIEYEASYKEKINVSWDIEKYVIDVFSEVPVFLNDIIINNRTESEYEVLEEKKIDTNLIGSKSVHIGIYDKATADYIILSKVVEVVDRVSPVIEVAEKIEIEDKMLEGIDLLSFINASDNYDESPKISVEYFTKDYIKLSNLEEFKAHILKYKESFVKYIVKDTSENVVVSDYISFVVIDTTAPIVNKIDKIILQDYQVDEFVIDVYFDVKDNYDNNPTLVVNYLLDKNYSFDEIKEMLKKGKDIDAEYYGVDDVNNKGDANKLLITVIDTTCPTLEVNDIEVNDVDFFNINFLDSVKVSDNFEKEVTLVTLYYIDSEIVEYSQFEEEVLRGGSGYILYEAFDSFGNTSGKKKQMVNVIDTTLPIVEIENIEEGKTYLVLNEIKYNASDNFTGYKVDAYLDGEIYSSQEITIGDHVFKVVATDSSGNESVKEVKFKVVENNIINNYMVNYFEIVIIVGALLLITIFIIVMRIIMSKGKKKVNNHFSL